VYSNSVLPGCDTASLGNRIQLPIDAMSYARRTEYAATPL
jgi:hypothetical protein